MYYKFEFGVNKKIRDTSYFGMNGSFFNTSNNKVENIAYQDGIPVRTSTDDAEKNLVGTSLVYWDGTSLKYAGILINTNTKDVYLVMTAHITATVADLRSAMMEHAGLGEGGSSGYWKGIMVDGGKSAQLRGETINSYSTILPRGVPQIISLKNKN